eukprot:gene11677-biopygen4877
MSTERLLKRNPRVRDFWLWGPRAPAVAGDVGAGPARAPDPPPPPACGGTARRGLDPRGAGIPPCGGWRLQGPTSTAAAAKVLPCAVLCASSVAAPAIKRPDVRGRAGGWCGAAESPPTAQRPPHTTHQLSA